MNLILPLVLAALLISCTTTQPTPAIPPTPSGESTEIPPILVSPDPEPPQDLASTATKGWSKQHDNLVLTTIPASFLQIPASRMAKFCPEWSKLDVNARKKFWTDFFYSLAMAESAHDGMTIYTESTMHTPDSVTGKRIYSEGYFQLSYQDKNAYGSKCDFGYSGVEKEVFLRETRGGARTGSWKVAEVRRMNQFGPNLVCAVRAAEFHLNYNQKEFADALDAYWYVLNRKHKEAYQRVWKALRSRGTPCS